MRLHHRCLLIAVIVLQCVIGQPEKKKGGGRKRNVDQTGETKKPCKYVFSKKRTICSNDLDMPLHMLKSVDTGLQEESLLQLPDPGDGFFKGEYQPSSTSDSHTTVQREKCKFPMKENLHESSVDVASNLPAWTSSWSPESPEGFEELCVPFQEWLVSDYLPRSEKRKPVRCLLAQHQGLGDQMKGVLRCWAAALVTQRPLVLDHSRSRSSWLWADASSIVPAAAVEARVSFNSTSFAGMSHHHRDTPAAHGTASLGRGSGGGGGGGGGTGGRVGGPGAQGAAKAANHWGAAAHAPGARGGGERGGGGSGGGERVSNRGGRRKLIDVLGGYGVGAFSSTTPTNASTARQLGAAKAHSPQGAPPRSPPPPPLLQQQGAGESELKAVEEVNEVEVGQDFKRADGLLPCADRVGVRVGGIKPFLGLKPAVFNLHGSAGSSTPAAFPSLCAPVLASAERLLQSLGASVGDEAFCLLRSLMQPSPRLRRTLEALLGGAVLRAQAQAHSPFLPPLPRSGSSRAADAGCLTASSSSSPLPPPLLVVGAPLPPPPLLGHQRHVPGHVPVVGLHLRLQEAISTEHDVNWGLRCASLIADQLAARGNGGRGSQTVVFVLASDTPSQLPAIEEALKQSAPCSTGNGNGNGVGGGGQQGGGGVVCAFASGQGVGEVGHISNKGTAGHWEVAQRNWADWFILSEASACVYSRSGFPRMACQASHHRAATGARIFEKSSCGKEGRQSWRNAETDVPPLDAGCHTPSRDLAQQQCALLPSELRSWSP